MSPATHPTDGEERTGERGATLTILALVLSMMLVALGTAHIWAARATLQAAYAREARQSALYVAEAGVVQAAARLEAGDADLPGDGVAHLPGVGSARYGVRSLRAPLVADAYLVESEGEATRGSRTARVAVQAILARRGERIVVEAWAIEGFGRADDDRGAARPGGSSSDGDGAAGADPGR